MRQMVINIGENINTALEETRNNFQGVLREDDFIKCYKSIVINLHNAFELIFKFMIQNRNEFMLFSLGGTSFDNLINKYKDAQKNGYSSLIKYSEDMGGILPHTITFRNSYQILAYLYSDSDFDEKFIAQLDVLEKLRNGFTHYTVKINYLELVIFKDLFKTAVRLYNNEIEQYNNTFASFHDKDKPVPYDKHMDLDEVHIFMSLCSEMTKKEILSNELCRIIIGGFVDGRNNVFIDTSLSDREQVADKLYVLKENELKNVLPRSSKRKIVAEIDKWLDYMLASEIIKERDICVDNYGTAFLGSIEISSLACELIEQVYRTENEIKTNLYIHSQNNLRWDMDYDCERC